MEATALEYKVTKLFHNQVVFHIGHPVYATGKLSSLVGLVCRIDKIAELDNPLVSLDVDLETFQGHIVHNCGFHLGRDGRVIDILTGTLVRLGG